MAGIRRVSRCSPNRSENICPQLSQGGIQIMI
jgi:hypothetical protein